MNHKHMTQSGAYVIADIIADITDPTFYPGKTIPLSYEDVSAEGTWFFWPKDWLSENFGGIFTAWAAKYPMVYSIGFSTPEAAIAAAEKWEAETPERNAHNTRVESQMLGIMGSG